MATAPRGRTMRAAHQRRATTGAATDIIKPGELVAADYLEGATLTAAARKLLVLLLHAAGGDAGDDRTHSIAKAALRGSHESNDRLTRALDELQRTLLRMPVKSPHGRDARKVVSILTHRIEEIADDARSTIWWKFSDELRSVIARSDHYAELRRQTLLALESRYAVSLYEMGALLYKRESPVWRGTLDQLRERFGVPAGKLPRWVDLQRFAITPAVEEVQQLAPFNVDWVDFRHGGKVIGVQFTFQSKPDKEREAAAREVSTSRVGRRARRQGTAERVVDPGLKAAIEALRDGKLPE